MPTTKCGRCSERRSRRPTGPRDPDAEAVAIIETKTVCAAIAAADAACKVAT